jgi:hypothetical protein
LNNDAYNTGNNYDPSRECKQSTWKTFKEGKTTGHIIWIQRLMKLSVEKIITTRVIPQVHKESSGYTPMTS